MGGDPADGGVHGPHWMGDDIAAVREDLLARGAGVSPIQDMGGVHYAFSVTPTATPERCSKSFPSRTNNRP